MNFSIIEDNIGLILNGLWVTFHLISLSLLIGFILALPLALVRHLKIKFFNQIIWTFTFFFRSTPLLLQIFLIYYGIAQFEWVRESFLWLFFKQAYLCGLLAFTLNTVAYTTEIFKGAMDNMNRNEIEAAKSFGMSKYIIYLRIVIPNSLRRSLPPYSNEVIFLLHSSSIASVITITELTGVANYIYSKYYDPFTPYITVAVMYAIIVTIISYIFKLLEKKYLAHLNLVQNKEKKVIGNPI